MLCGVGEEARDQAARYAKERFQFGRAIGVFQAVKHRCADMAVRSEAAWSQTVYAALALRDGHADAGLHVSSAKVLATDAAIENASSNVQVHGGYGFTTEFDAHLLVKRAHVLDRMAGLARIHVATVLAAPAPE
jgi:alkylation response protein AidB-like acyl-CoA dehydrogenase